MNDEWLDRLGNRQITYDEADILMDDQLLTLWERAMRRYSTLDLWNANVLSYTYISRHPEENTPSERSERIKKLYRRIEKA
jgi:hypothetical protein